ncbi:MAG: secondary thiamine-phosphate synthase enzyme YjbQ [Candidatus Binatia bacterium]
MAASGCEPGIGAMHRELNVRTRQRLEVIDLTGEVARVVAEADDGAELCTVYVPHATAAVVINENDDPNLCDDLLDALERLVPAGQWRHDRVDGNGAAHIKAAMLGPSETVPVRDGRLALGTWQAIMLVELDGPRQRRVIVTVR